MKDTLLVAAFLAAAMSPLAAQTYPPAVNKVIQEARLICGAAGFRINHGEIERKDIFGRGKSDYVLSDASWSCSGRGPMFSGSGGSTTWIVSDIKGSHALIFEELVRDIHFDGKGGISLALHGSACGKAGFEACQRSLKWDGRKFAGPPPR